MSVKPIFTSSNASKMSILGWWMVHTTVLPVSTVLRTVRITIAAALASNPEVGSSMNMMEGLATSSTATVSRFLCSVDSPETPGRPTRANLKGVSSTNSITSSTNACNSTSCKLAWCMRFDYTSSEHWLAPHMTPIHLMNYPYGNFKLQSHLASTTLHEVWGVLM